MKEEEAKLKTALDAKVHKVGNLVHDSVIAAKDEDLNEVT